MRVKDQVAVVTGGGRGMGRAVVLGLAREGAKVMVGELDPATGEETAETVRSEGGAAHAIGVDVGRVADVQRLFDETVARFGTVDILVNNAGIGIAKPLVDFTEAEWDLQMAVNLKGVFFCTQAAARIMIPRRRGKIVNFASTSGFVSSTVPEVPYDVSKGGVRQMTISAAGELAPYGIHVNAVAPGTVLTGLTRQVLDTEERMARAAAKIPLNRLGTPEDIVGPVLFLCSPESDYVTGHVLVVDGGWLVY